MYICVGIFLQKCVFILYQVNRLNINVIVYSWQLYDIFSKTLMPILIFSRLISLTKFEVLVFDYTLFSHYHISNLDNRIV